MLLFKRFTLAEVSVDIVEEANFFLASLPVEINQFMFADREKIDGTAVDIPEITAEFIDRHNIILKRKDDGLELRTFAQVFPAIRRIGVMDFFAGQEVQNQKLVVPLLHFRTLREEGLGQLLEDRHETIGFTEGENPRIQIYFSSSTTTHGMRPAPCATLIIVSSQRRDMAPAYLPPNS